MTMTDREPSRVVKGAGLTAAAPYPLLPGPVSAPPPAATAASEGSSASRAALPLVCRPILAADDAAQPQPVCAHCAAPNAAVAAGQRASMRGA
jgi:hypothetical protein